jgi:UPF0716 protein FxsA
VPLLALIALFVIVPFLELYVILEVVGPALGAPLTILLLAADSIIGALLFKSQGRSVWRRFNLTMAEGRMPHREVIDGVLVIFGGAFLITPGFISDIAGILLLLPPTRAVIRRLLIRRLGRRVLMAEPRRGSRPPRGYDVEGSAREYDDVPQPRLER